MSIVKNMVDVMACVIKAPRTVPELCEVTGVSPDAVRRYMHALESEGLVNAERLPRAAKRGGNSRIRYEWNA